MCTNIKEYKRYKELFEEYWLKKREHFVRSPFEFVTTQEFLFSFNQAPNLSLSMLHPPFEEDYI